jgi:hypothetical protein
MATRPAKVPILLLLLPLATLSCAQAPVRRLPVVDEMPPAPERASPGGPAGDFIAFYPRVPSVLDTKPDLSRYVIECSEASGRGYFSLALRDDGKSALYVLTAGRVTDLSRAIGLEIDGRGSLDWGFVYDRNGDGWADYFAFFLGLNPIETPDIPAQVPKRGPTPEAAGKEDDPAAFATQEELKLMRARLKLVFIHYADDDFDGGVDALVSALQDPDRWGWVYRRAVVRSRSHSQVADEDWTFLSDIHVREGPVPRLADGRMTPLLGFRWRENHLQGVSGFLGVINAGLRACRIPKGALPRE